MLIGCGLIVLTKQDFLWDSFWSFYARWPVKIPSLSGPEITGATIEFWRAGKMKLISNFSLILQSSPQVQRDWCRSSQLQKRLLLLPCLCQCSEYIFSFSSNLSSFVDWVVTCQKTSRGDPKGIQDWCVWFGTGQVAHVPTQELRPLDHDLHISHAKLNSLVFLGWEPLAWVLSSSAEVRLGLACNLAGELCCSHVGRPAVWHQHIPFWEQGCIHLGSGWRISQLSPHFSPRLQRKWVEMLSQPDHTLLGLDGLGAVGAWSEMCVWRNVATTNITDWTLVS